MRPHPSLNFIRTDDAGLSTGLISALHGRSDCVLILQTTNEYALAALRAAFFRLDLNDLALPVVIHRTYQGLGEDARMMFPAVDVGGLLIDGYGDGIMLSDPGMNPVLQKQYNTIGFGVLQAARTRITKTEYISCPSCGRTLFDLQETTAMIRKRTDHLKGIKIGIMGCIVNGPGEMADADYGYVGSGKDRITLYKGKEVMKRGVPSTRALDELIGLIKEDGRWTDPQAIGGN